MDSLKDTSIAGIITIDDIIVHRSDLFRSRIVAS